MTLYVCKWLHIVRTYPTLVLVRDRGLGPRAILPLLLLLAFRLPPPPPRLLAHSCGPSPLAAHIRSYVANCRREGESEYRIDYASNDFSLNARVSRSTRAI